MNKNNLEDFIMSISSNIMKVRMDLSLYNGDYDCACGKKHQYGPHITLLCQGKWRVVMQCPDNPDYLTCVKIKMFLLVKFKGFEAISGYKLKNQEERIGYQYMLNQLR